MLTKRKSCIIGNRRLSERKLAGSAELGKSRVGGWTLFERIMIKQPESAIRGKVSGLQVRCVVPQLLVFIVLFATV